MRPDYSKGLKPLNLEEINMSKKFRITLRRWHKPRPKGPVTLFFPPSFFPSVNKNSEDVGEVAEARVLEVTLTEDCVSELMRSYVRKNGAEAIKSFAEHQLSHDGSFQAWSEYGALHFMVVSVEEVVA